MDDVAAGEAQQNVGVGGDYEFAGGDDRFSDLDVAALACGIFVLPPPLLSGDVDDALGVGPLVELEDLDHCRHGDGGEDDRRQHSERDLELRVAVCLLRGVLAAILVLDQDVADHAEHDEGDHAREVEDVALAAETLVDVAGVLTGGAEEVLGCILGTSRQHPAGDDGHRRK